MSTTIIRFQRNPCPAEGEPTGCPTNGNIPLCCPDGNGCVRCFPDNGCCPGNTCCPDNDVFEYAVVDGDPVVRQSLNPDTGIPAQQGAAFLFGKQNITDPGNALYYDPGTNTFIVGDTPLEEVQNSNVVGNDNTLTSTDQLSLIGTDNTLNASDRSNIHGDFNTVMDSEMTDLLGERNVVLRSANTTVTGDLNQITEKPGIIVTGNSNLLADSATGERDIVVLGSENSLTSDTSSTEIGAFFLSGLSNEVAAPFVDDLTISGIENNISTSSIRSSNFLGHSNDFIAGDTTGYNAVGSDNRVEIPASASIEDLYQIGRFNNLGFAEEDLAPLVIRALLQTGISNEIIADPESDGGTVLRGVIQDGVSNTHMGYGVNLTQLGNRNASQIHPGYEGQQLGHDNIVDREPITVTEFNNGTLFPLPASTDQSSSFSLVGMSNVALVAPNVSPLSPPLQNSILTNGDSNRVSIGGEGTDNQALNTASIIGNDNVSISDPDTASSHQILGNTNTLFTIGLGDDNIVEGRRTNVFREVTGSMNVVTTNRSQSYVQVKGMNNTMTLEGEAEIDNVDVQGFSNTVLVADSDSSHVDVDGEGNLVNLFSYNSQSTKVEGADNTISLTGVNRDVRDEVDSFNVRGADNVFNDANLHHLVSRNVTVEGTNNSYSAITGASHLCYFHQLGVNNVSSSSDILTERRVAYIIQQGTGNVVRDEAETQEVISSDQHGSANYSHLEEGVLGYIGQRGSTNYISVDNVPAMGEFITSSLVKRTIQDGGVIDRVPVNMVNPINLQYEHQIGYGVIDEPGNKSLFDSQYTNYGIMYVNDDIIGAAISRAMVGRGLGYNAQEFNAQGTGYATMYRKVDDPILPGRFVTVNGDGLVEYASPGSNPILGISSVNAGFRSFEQVIYPEDYYSQSPVGETETSVVDYRIYAARDVLAAYCCRADFLDIDTLPGLITFATLNCPDAVPRLTEINNNPDDYTQVRPVASEPMIPFIPKSKNTDEYVEVTLTGVAYLEIEDGEDAPPGTRLSTGLSGIGVVDAGGQFIVVDAFLPDPMDNFVAVTRFI